MTDSQPRDDREKKHQKQHEKNGNYCDCNRKNAIKFGGFKKKQYLRTPPYFVISPKLRSQNPANGKIK